MSEGEEVICPFCKEGSFDLTGLEMHLMNSWCNVFGKLCATPKPSASDED